ncbi:unnamed protein product [Spirodela intermedia]|uniref:Uncharacterized protein n=1 Tax=Spirodela intermedia TaxID=51605 RepID=A0A7I8JEH9_SPIIN|nr:unnamed protein product [Spirodela intermedia]CAA6667802.1 unnamed protein product [Spirodela intermedia]
MATPRKPAGLLLVLCLVLCAAAGHELYVAEEGETLQTISVKCDADFILDDNPHIQDTDDVGPGTVLFIRPSI